MTPGFWNGRSVLITGHTGFKGSWLALWLQCQGARVTGFALPPETSPSLFDIAVRDHVRTIFGDVRDLRAVVDCVAEIRPDIVFHMAAQSLVRKSYREPVETYATNVMGTVHVLEAVRGCPSTQAVVIVTSDKCYENRGWVWGYRENEPMGGHDPYSNSKGCAELAASAYRRSFFEAPDGCKIASGRAGNVIGGGDWSEDRLIPDIVRSFAVGQAVEIRSPKATRPWQHVLEPLSGYVTLAERLCGVDGQSFADGWNFGPADNDCMPVSYVVERLVKLWGGTAAWRLSAAQHPHEAHLLKVDASKAQALLDWSPRLRLNDALAWTVDWYLRQLAGENPFDLIHEQIARYESLEPARLAAE